MAALATWDIVGALVCYIFISYGRLGRWELGSTGALAVILTWLGIGYLFGYYSESGDAIGSELPKQLGVALISASSIVLVFVIHSWLFQVTDAQTRFRGFLIPLAVMIMIVSLLGRALLRSFGKKSYLWIVVCSWNEKELLLREIEKDIRVMLEGRNEIRYITDNDYVRIEEFVSELGRKVQVVAGSSVIADTLGSEFLLGIRAKGTKVMTLVDWCEIHLNRIPSELVTMKWLLEADGFSLHPGGSNWRVKRFVDIAGASCLAIAFIPVVIIVAILIFLEDRGPIFYTQRRTGLNGRVFDVWKLRSMRVDAEANGIKWSTKDDARVTKIGRLIRATRVDELPQLMSVISGEMSLIGPRPERPELDKELAKAIPYYKIRYNLRPGLSGWAQVSYPYGASIEDTRTKLSYDIYYMRNSGILMDMLITIKTIQLVINAKGASPVTR